MKRLSIIIVIIMMFALTMSSFAATLTDVPANHWAYSAVNEIVASGILEGYPDGTFKGNDSVTRYQLSVVLVRVLDQIRDGSGSTAVGNDDLKFIEDKVDAMVKGLTIAQAADVQAIVQKLLEKSNTNIPAGANATEITRIIENLTKEFADDIKKLIVNLDAQKQVANLRYKSLDERLNALDAKISGSIAAVDSKYADELKKLSVNLDAQKQVANLRYKSLDGRINDLSAGIAAEDAKIVAVDKKFVDELKKLSVNLDAQKQVANLRYKSLDGRINDLVSSVADVNKGIATDINKINVNLDAQKQVANLRYKSLDGRINDLVSSVADVNKGIATDINKINVNLDAQKQVANLRYKSLDGRINSNVDAIAANIAAIDAKIVEITNPSVIQWKAPTYNINYKEAVITGAGTAYIDPFDTDLNNNNKIDGNEKYAAAALSFNQSLGMGLSIAKGSFSADLALNAVNENFLTGAQNAAGFSINAIKGTINDDGFSAIIDSRQKPILRSYLLGGDGNDVVDGVVANVEGNDYVLVNNIFAGETTVADAIMGNDLNVAFGIENAVGARNMIFGLDTQLEVAGFTVTPEFAFSDKKLAQRYLNVNANGVLGPVKTTFAYTDNNGLVPIKAFAFAPVNGYKLQGEIDTANIKAIYEDYYNLPVIRLSASQNFDIADLTLANSFSYDRFTGDNSGRNQYQVSTSKKINDDLTVKGSINWLTLNNAAQYQTNQVNYNKDYTSVEADKFDKTIEATYLMGQLTTTGKITHDINSDLYHKYTADYKVSDALTTGVVFEKKVADPNFGQTYTANYKVSDSITTSAKLSKGGAAASLLQHTYTADYAQDIITAGVVKNINKDSDSTIISASVGKNKEISYELMNVTLKPYADFGYRMDTVPGDETNYTVGATTSKALTEKVSLNAEVQHGQREFKSADYVKADQFIAGTKNMIKGELVYTISDTVNAKLTYENVNFDAAAIADSYDAKVATATIGVKF